MIAPVGLSIAEGLRIHGVGDRAEQRDRVAEMLELVGLRADHASRRNGNQATQRECQKPVISRRFFPHPDRFSKFRASSRHTRRCSAGR